MASPSPNALTNGQHRTPEPAAALPTASLPWWGRMETLWLMLAPVGMLALVLAQPLSPNDLWYHVRAGEFIARLGHVPDQNGMSLAVPLTKPYFYQSWLAELLLYLTLQKAGLGGLQVLRALCFAGGLALVVAASFRTLLRVQSVPNRLLATRLCAIFAFLTLAMGLNNVDLRPQTFSVLLFGAFVFSLGEWYFSKKNVWAIALLLITWLWANTHGAFVVAPFLLTIFALSSLVQGTPTERKVRWAVVVASLGLICINPHGLGLFAYVARLSTDTISQKYIAEWQSPSPFEPYGALLYLSFLPLLALAIKTRVRHLPLWGAALLLFVMASRDARAVIWYGLWLPTLLSAALGQLITDQPKPATPSRGAALINVTLIGALWLPALFLLPWLKPLLPLPTSYTSQFAPTPQRLFAGSPPLLLERQTAVEPAEYLLQHPPKGRLFTDMLSGSYLTWATYPEVKAWCDPRIELFPAEFWEDYMRLSAGPKAAEAEFKAKGFSDILLDNKTQQELVRQMSSSSAWKQVAKGGPTILFRLIK